MSMHLDRQLFFAIPFLSHFDSLFSHDGQRYRVSYLRASCSRIFLFFHLYRDFIFSFD
jgi:hypothetical protein